MKLSRKINRWWAKSFGYFWLPCPLCGECFGGHEIKKRELTVFVTASDEWVGKVVCKSCEEAVRSRHTPLAARIHVHPLTRKERVVAWSFQKQQPPEDSPSDDNSL